jgi:hypothetical protein
MRLLIELPEYWGKDDVLDVASHLRADTTIKTDREALATALEKGLPLDELIWALQAKP